MIKVICIDSKSRKNELTINKIYEGKLTEGTSNKFFRIINDNGDRRNYYAHRFITLAEFREQRINSILND